MNPNLTEIVYIMDRSGSMHHLTMDVVGGFNSFVEEQKKVEGDAVITTVLFNTEIDTVHNHVNLSNVVPMKIEDFQACGMTALMDAVGSAIDSVGKRLSETPENDRPSKVLFVIMTDGMENASRKYDVARVKEMIEHQQTKYGWEFIFVGAGIDAYAVGNTIGIKGENTMNTRATTDGVSAMYCAMSAATTSLRSKGFVDSKWKEGHESGC